MTTKTVILDDIGDLSAPRGSKPWAIAVRMKLQNLLERVQSTEGHILPYLEGL